jgi:hypothetical protein
MQTPFPLASLTLQLKGRDSLAGGVLLLRESTHENQT